MKTVKILLTAIVMSVCFQPVQAQLPEPTLKKIDDLFKPWANSTGPGCAIAIVRHDSVLLAKGYGLANLEYKIPISSGTTFNLASLSKQFTGFAIIHLVQTNQIGLQDDIRQYLPWFPDLKTKISIQNLLNHTSGIRTCEQLLAIAGTRDEDVATREDIIKVLSRQRGLNFKPGSQYGYSNSNFFLLGEIVQTVTKKTLRAYTDSLIFKPLGMPTTHFHDRYDELEPFHASSYYHNKTGYTNALVNISYAGPTNLYSSAADLARWLVNFYQPKIGDQRTIQLLATPGKLDDGTELKTANGIEVDRYRDLLRYAHSGIRGGYRTFLQAFPASELGIVILSNTDDIRSQRLAEQVADLFLPAAKNIQPPAINPADTVLATLKDDHLKPFLGNYISDDLTAVKVAIRNGKAVLQYENGGMALLTPVNANTFAAFGHPEVTYAFSKKHISQTWPGRKREFSFYDPAPLTDAQLITYTGTYHCPELECSYHIALKDHQLWLSGSKDEDIPFKLYGKERLTNTSWFMPNLLITRDSKGMINGFEINTERVMHLRFHKLLKKKLD